VRIAVVVRRGGRRHRRPLDGQVDGAESLRDGQERDEARDEQRDKRRPSRSSMAPQTQFSVALCSHACIVRPWKLGDLMNIKRERGPGFYRVRQNLRSIKRV
jgi:hypothetical protein